MIEGQKCTLVPYSKECVEEYHSWFIKYPELLECTGSELLSLEEEYSNQESWEQDENKLTFLIHKNGMLCGDINAFFSDFFAEDFELDVLQCESPLIAELNLMIAEPSCRRQGIAQEALDMFVEYIERKMDNVIVLVAKILKSNMGSILFFEKNNFIKYKTLNCFNEVHYMKKVR